MGRGKVELMLDERLHRLAKYEVAATLQDADNCHDYYNAPGKPLTTAIRLIIL